MEKQTTQQAGQAAEKAAQPKKAAQKATEAQKRAREPEIYTIKIVPDKGDEVRSIRLSSRWLKFGLGSLAVGAMLFVGAFSYAVYSTFTHRSDAAEIQELRQVNSIQQEQLLNLSKKANALQDQMEELTQKEQELRRLSGAAPAKDDLQANGQQQAGASAPDASGNEEEQHDGQGGPYVAPDIDNVNAVLDDVEKRLAVRRASLEALQQELQEQQQELGKQLPGLDGLLLPGSTTPSLWPARGEVSSPYGLRWNGSEFHPGIDIANDAGTPIVATADGVVTYAGWNDGGYGNMVDIDHGNGVTTRYGHAMQVVVVTGQHVRRGQVIAYMGSTGRSTGPHVHYEVRVNGSTVNPISYL